MSGVTLPRRIICKRSKLKGLSMPVRNENDGSIIVRAASSCLLPKKGAGKKEIEEIQKAGQWSSGNGSDEELPPGYHFLNFKTTSCNVLKVIYLLIILLATVQHGRVYISLYVKPFAQQNKDQTLNYEDGSWTSYKHTIFVEAVEDLLDIQPGPQEGTLTVTNRCGYPIEVHPNTRTIIQSQRYSSILENGKSRSLKWNARKHQNARKIILRVENMASITIKIEAPPLPRLQLPRAARGE